ncbi:MAG: Crp/Fnr family transcriptional regulator [Marinilabiliales bacterium]|nr:MAG: Crp/Fnr family transcriptional regulator [Marinilabiliales bacterium]
MHDGKTILITFEDMDNSHNCLECTRSSKCFKKLVPSELEFINAKKKQIEYRKGENICKQGAFASYVLYISEGLVKLYVESVNRKNINIKILKEGEFIGLSSIFDDNIYNYSSVALKDSRVCLIEKDGIRRLLENNGIFASEIIKGYCRNEKNLFDIIKSIGHKQMPGRIADALIYLCSEDFDGIDVFKYITRKDIGDFACISKESTVKLLTELKNEGIIDTEGKRIQITAPDRLKEISKRG